MKIRTTGTRRAIVGSICLLFVLSGAFAQGFDNFVSVSGNKLMDGDKEFRFISFNVPTLNYQEDEMTFTLTNPYRLPDEFEMRDVFETVKEMGGQVIRIYTIPVRNKNFPSESPTYVEGPGQFNEEAFKVTDLMLALANEWEEGPIMLNSAGKPRMNSGRIPSLFQISNKPSNLSLTEKIP